MFGYGVDVLWENVAFTELAVSNLIHDETEHLTVANVQFQEDRRVRGSLVNGFPRTKFDRSRTKLGEDNLDGFISGDVGNFSRHETHFIGVYLCIRFDRDQPVMFEGRVVLLFVS